MTYDNRKKALKYLMFQKEKETGQSRHEDVQMAGHKGYIQQKKRQAPQQCHWRPQCYHAQ